MIEIRRCNFDKHLVVRKCRTFPVTMTYFNFDPRGRRAIITGGSQGLGLEFARRLISQGARVCIFDIDTTAGESSVRELRKQYGVGNDG